MNKMLEIGRSGMQAQQLRLNRISGNMANVETVGFKRSEVTFSEEVRSAMAADSVALSSELPEDRRLIGGGVHALKAATVLHQGALYATESFFDMAIEGVGFFGVRGQSGELHLTRQGSFTLQQDGRLVDNMGRTLEMEALIDPASWEVQQLSLSGTGEIFRRDPSTGDQTLAGRVCLFDVRDQSRLRAAGAGTFIPAEGAGLIRSTESPEAFGILKSATLERSNVNLLDEMTQLLMTQRAYQLSAKSVGSADEMMQLINEII